MNSRARSRTGFRLFRSRSRSARFDFLEFGRATSRDVNYKRKINNPGRLGSDLLRRGTPNRRGVVIRVSRERKAITAGCNPRDARRYCTEI